MSVSIAVGAVRTWVALYTFGLPPELRDERRAEIESDLYEQRLSARLQDQRSLATSGSVALRLTLGMLFDIVWRVQVGLFARSDRRHQVARDRRFFMDSVFEKQLSRTLDSTDLKIGTKYEGKVRDSYITGDGRRILVATDRISAFDVVLGTIPFKGQVLNQMAQHWFEATRHIVANHVIRVPDPNVTIAHELEPLAVEFVMRAYLTGSTSTSIWRAYERGDRTFCGHVLPDGMRCHEKLPEPLLTPSTKAGKGNHDVSVSREQLLQMGVISAEDFDAAAKLVKELFAFGQKFAAERGLILVDTKYEIGKNPQGELVVMDEIHTPDSSRYWYADDYDARMANGEEPRGLDKEYVRRWLVDNHGYRGDGPAPSLPDEVRVEAARRYVEIFQLVTGRTFEPDTQDPQARLARNLQGVA